MPNYGANATKPQVQQPFAVNPQGQMEPKSIRDYLAIAKQDAARFTNIPGEAKPGTMYMPESQPGSQPDQAISDGPSSAYEQMPFSQRVGLSPYVRAKERVKTMLPELWGQMFPGYQQGASLSPEEMQKWNGAVEALTGNLLQHFDKQYGAAIKVKNATKKQRADDQRYWQQFYHTQTQKGSPPINRETGKPIPEAEYVRERMSQADEIRIKDELRNKEPGVQKATEQYSPQDVVVILKRNPELKRQIMFQVKRYLEQTVGTMNEEKFRLVMSDDKYKQIRNEAIHDTLEQYKDELRKASGQ